MKRSFAFNFSLLLSLLGALFVMVAQPVLGAGLHPQVQEATPVGPILPPGPQPAAEGALQGYYFYANDCPHCIAIVEEVLNPMAGDYGDLLDIRLLEIGIPAYYEAMLAVEAHYGMETSEWRIPILVLNDTIMIGEDQIRDEFPTWASQSLAQGGAPFPDIPDINPAEMVSVAPNQSLPEDEQCDTDDGCQVAAPIFIAYFYQTGCDVCSRVTADLNYLKTIFPQIQVAEFNIYDHADLATWMTEQVGFEGSFTTPALFIGETVVLEEELHPDTLIPVIESYTVRGVKPIWLDFDAEEGQQSIVSRFKNMGWLAVVAAGLIDGINPCAFATLIFFVSYLTLSGRKGKEVLFVGSAFALGVFLAYLAIGLGLYQLLETLDDTLDIIAKIVYAVTGVFCLVLAVLSFIDYRKARQGEIGDMLLKLPEPLRKRINATIRKGRKTRNYVLGAFFAGVLISFLELACTGQVYLPTIIFVSSIPELRLRALFYLVIYNLLFILPLVIIFILVYFGTTSKELTRWLEKRAALVKLGMGILFIALGAWLLFSLVG